MKCYAKIMKLRDWLDEQNIKVPYLAKRMGVHRVHIYNCMNGRKRPSKKLARAISEFTGGEVTIEELRGENPLNK